VPSGRKPEVDANEPPPSILLSEWQQEPARTGLEVCTALDGRHGLLDVNRAWQIPAVTDDNGGEIHLKLQ